MSASQMAGEPDTRHDCPHPTCTKRVPFTRLACRTHWQQLPYALKRAVLDAWRAGDVTAHMQARSEAVAWWAS